MANNQKPKKRNNDVSFFLHVLPDSIKSEINVAQLGKVVKLYDDNKKAYIEPLALKSNGEQRPILVGVHIGKRLRKEISVDDVALVTFLDRSIANFNGDNKPFELSSKRMHSLNDAFVIDIY